MTNIFPGSAQRFFVAAILSLSIPLIVIASPQLPKDGDSTAYGRPGMAAEEMPPPPPLHGINLDEAQRDRVFDIMHAQAPLMRSKFKAWRKAEDDLHRLAGSSDYSEAKAKQQADAMARAMSEIALLRVHTDRQLFDVLTPEQRQQLVERQDGKELAMAGHPPPFMGGERRMPPPR